MVVDKSRFVRIAPKYYLMGIVSYFMRLQGPSTKNRIQVFFSEPDESGYVDVEDSLLSQSLVFNEAIDLLVGIGALKALADPFAATIYLQSEFFYERWNDLIKEEPYSIYSTLGDGGEEWLRGAIESVNKRYEELDIKRMDFVKEDTSWQPIDIDRNDENYKEAVAKISDAIKEIEQNNGYAATEPEQRDFVLSNLKQTQAKLTTADTISAAYLRESALKPLIMICEKYGKAALGLASKVAGQAIMQFLKSRGVDVLDHVYRAFTHFL